MDSVTPSGEAVVNGSVYSKQASAEGRLQANSNGS
jgi:hypothetical protein